MNQKAPHLNGKNTDFINWSSEHNTTQSDKEWNYTCTNYNSQIILHAFLHGPDVFKIQTHHSYLPLTATMT